MRAFADEVVFRNLGKRGKRIELIKDLPATSIADQLAAEAQPTGQPPVAEDAFALRLMTVDDALPLARCIYRSYGYTYGNDVVYYPSKVVELLDSGRMVSCVAVNQAGEVVGHLALQFAKAGAEVADSGIAVVDPRYRGRKLFEQMKTFMAEWAGRNGVYGLVSEAVAVHPITQKGNINLGASETGVLLGYLPAGLEFRNIKGGAEVRRQSAVMFYLRTNPEPEREVFAPPHHQDVIQRLYDKIPLRRTCRPAPPEATLGAVRDQHSVIEQRLKPETARAFIRIEEYGGDVLELVHRHLRDLCLRKFDCIFLDLPLGKPLTAVLCRAFEGVGFSFAGVGVELADGDSLRLLYLNNVEIDAAGMVVISEHGRALTDYVLTAREDVGRLRLAEVEG